MQGRTDNEEDNSYRETTSLQRMLQALYSYTVDGVALSTVIMCEFIPVGEIPQPYKELVKGAALDLAFINAANAIHALSGRKHPFDGLTTFNTLKHIFAHTLPIVTTVSLGFAIKYFGGDAADDCFNSTNIENSTATGEGPIILTNPLSHNALLALLVYSQFGMTKWLIDMVKRPAKVNEEGGQNLLQTLLKTGINVIEPIAMYEASRMILLNIGQGAVLHHHFFPPVVIGFDLLLKFWGYMSCIPRPLDSLVPEEGRIQELNVNDDEAINEFLDSGGQRKLVSPSCSSIAKYAGYYSMRALFAAAAGLAVLEVTNYLRAETDQEKLESSDRLLNLLGIVGAVEVAGLAFDVGVKAAGSLWSQCRQTFFGGAPRGYTRVDTEEEYITNTPLYSKV